MAPVLLGNDFFFLAHDDLTGRARADRRTVGLGLAAALLGELVFEGKLVARDERLHVVDRRPPRDALSHATLDQIVAEPRPRGIRTWLVFFSQDAQASIAARLRRAGLVRQEEVRRLLRHQVVHVPVDMNTAAWPGARLATRLAWHDPMEPWDVFLASLVVATGLDRHVLQAAPAAAYMYLEHLAAELPSTLRDLVAHTRAAVGDAVLAHLG